jgi:sodium-dependent dicarboxylate transporter 2/3/5
MAVWWASGAIPVAATALLPLVLFPLLGVATIQETAAPYANPLIYLFLGGFLIALSAERWSLHRRIALYVLSRIGSTPGIMVGGFMLITAFLSMWVSNTATTIMMLPVALAVVPMFGTETDGVLDEDSNPFAIALMLAVAYGASIGGLATLVGTPPNALLAGFFEQTYGIDIGFARWMLLGLPVTLVMLAVTWLFLTRRLMNESSPNVASEDFFEQELTHLGPMSRAEKRVASIFLLTATLWMLRPLLQAYFDFANLSDPGIAIFGALLLFIVPADWSKRDFLLNWTWAKRAPWDVLILFGGGLSLAAAIDSTGLAIWLGDGLLFLGTYPLMILVLGIVGLVIYLTELTSNTATTATFLPVVAAFATELEMAPLQLAAPAAIAASCAFMLPVATPPNAIVYSSGYVSISSMARAGFWLNIAGMIVISIVAMLLVPVFF